MSKGIECMWMRGGTSKGAYFLADALPSDEQARADILLRVMGSPDARQIDGMGGADPLASKVAVVKKSQRGDADVDYLFLQVFVDQAIVTDAQNCGNILAGVGPFAIERGLVDPVEGETQVRIFMENTGQIAVARVQVKDGEVVYEGDARIDGVPGFSAPVPITFQDTAGSSCGALLPTGNAVDMIDGVEVTMIDNGMPCVVMRASDMGISGTESREELEANDALRAKLEAIRLKAGPMMNLGDVKEKSVPKMTMVSAPQNGGAISTRTFIPHRCHASIGVLGAVSVATAAVLPGSPANGLASYTASSRMTLDVEHPTGCMTVVLDQDDAGNVGSAALLRTARKLFDGKVFVHSNGLNPLSTQE
ncbi:4-oxalomesaconate tautomerase [Maribrevibacterium harenarium]|uniref:4-oxalomesaconate tautomerase n=1 Tax=Maribrevibacterium harenarium TaxID=2589817 RepID=A0A501WC40_9GAMM|nr:4-oxalomesaconate tautomerase [Maribrevibacterium harenarium]TPE47503.1 4-oxalomesaconate tautomerase [Maribrevibacterium harenarium]